MKPQTGGERHKATYKALCSFNTRDAASEQTPCLELIKQRVPASAAAGGKPQVTSAEWAEGNCS